MPRLDHQVTLEGLFSYQERMMVSILTTTFIKQLNILRVEAGLPLLTQQAVLQDLRQEARAYIRAHPQQETR